MGKVSRFFRLQDKGAVLSVSHRSGRDKITQERLAELANVSTSTIGNLESEKIVQGVSPYTLWKISKVLHISIEQLFEDGKKQE